MNRLIGEAAGCAVLVGGLLGVGSCTADVLTCPGDVETVGSGDAQAPVIICDEDPEHDDFLDNPGTTEQKVMFAGFGIAALGGAVMFIASREGGTEGESDVSQE